MNSVLCADGIKASGASFPYPFYSTLLEKYEEKTGLSVNYQPIGSSKGYLQLKNQTVDFAGTDMFLNDLLLSKMPFPHEVLHVPMSLSAVAISYNLPGNPELFLTPDVIADIFMGQITTWNDDRIQSLNPALFLPDLEIVPIYRKGGSGTTYIFSEYLSKVNTAWRQTMGANGQLNWMVGLGAKGNKGVAKLINQIPGSISYISNGFATQSKLKQAFIENQSGQFVQPTPDSISLAGNIDLPEDTRLFCTNTTAKYGYPISSFTWLILFKEQSYNSRSMQTAKQVKDLLLWMATDGQKFARSLGYAPLSTQVSKKSERIIKKITYNDQSL